MRKEGKHEMIQFKIVTKNMKNIFNELSLTLSLSPMSIDDFNLFTILEVVCIIEPFSKR